MHRALLTALGLAVAIVGGSCSCLETWECGYGGPGCGEPGLRGLCEPLLVIDAPTDALVVFGDDTGQHPATLRSFESSDPALLEVVRGPGEGELTLTARGPGEATLTLDVDGWDAPRRWELALIDGADAPPQGDEACADGFIHPDAP